jgi:hypothetical protein
MILDAAKRGLRRAGALWGLVVFLLVVNLATAAVLAVPLAQTLRDDLASRAAADNMLSGFDYPWWSAWADAHPQTTFGPDILGTGFAFKNLDLLLRGRLPGELFGCPIRTGRRDTALDPPSSPWRGLPRPQVFPLGRRRCRLRAAAVDCRGLLHGSGFISDVSCAHPDVPVDAAVSRALLIVRALGRHPGAGSVRAHRHV